MSIWVLTIAFGCTYWGCTQSVEFPNEASCYRALEKIKIPTGEVGKTAVAYCYPKAGERK